MSVAALAPTAPCRGCDRMLVETDGVWRHPGGGTVMLRCGGCGHLAAVGREPCSQCGAQDWRTDHVASPAIAEPSADARRIGTMALVEVGCLLWSDKRVNHHDEPIGGVVVAWDWSAPDEDGERQKVYTVVAARPDTLHGGPFTVRRLREDELTGLSVEIPREGQVRALVRRLATEYGRATGPILPGQTEWIRWVWELSVAVGAVVRSR